MEQSQKRTYRKRAIALLITWFVGEQVLGLVIAFSRAFQYLKQGSPPIDITRGAELVGALVIPLFLLPLAMLTYGNAKKGELKSVRIIAGFLIGFCAFAGVCLALAVILQVAGVPIG